MQLNRDELAALIPHDGGMCLLDRVLRYDERSILCATASHRSPDHPLRRDGALSALIGLEYAAQAAAVHGGLLAFSRGASPRQGFLVGGQDVRLYAERLDDIATDLDVSADCLIDNGDSVVYAFAIHGDGRLLLEGRLSVFFTPDP